MFFCFINTLVYMIQCDYSVYITAVHLLKLHDILSFNPCRRPGPLSAVCCRQCIMRPFDLVSVGASLLLPVDWTLRNAYWRLGAWNEKLSDYIQSLVSVYCRLSCSLRVTVPCLARRSAANTTRGIFVYHEWDWTDLIILFVHHHWTDLKCHLEAVQVT